MNLGTRESYPLARAREERAQTRWSFFFFFFVVVVSRLCDPFFFFRARVSFFYRDKQELAR